MKLSERERLARMRKVWVSEGPSNFEVASARSRIAHRLSPAGSQQSDGSRPPRGPVQAHGLLADLVLGLSLAGAVVVAAQWWFDNPASAPLASLPMPGSDTLPGRAGAESTGMTGLPTGKTGSELEPARHATGPVSGHGAAEGNLNVSESVVASGQASPTIERGGVVTTAAPGVVYEVAAGERVTVLLRGERTVVEGPRLIEFTFEADRASGFRMHLSTPAANAKKASTSTPVPARGKAAEEVGAWARAAEALRRGDRERAEQALLELSDGPASEGADSAALALAQLWIARGDAERARPVLERLSSSAQSSVVRRRATELLGQR